MNDSLVRAIARKKSIWGPAQNYHCYHLHFSLQQNILWSGVECDIRIDSETKKYPNIFERKNYTNIVLGQPLQKQILYWVNPYDHPEHEISSFLLCFKRYSWSKYGNNNHCQDWHCFHADDHHRGMRKGQMGDKNTPDGWIITILDIMAIVMIVIREGTPPKISFF